MAPSSHIYNAYSSTLKLRDMIKMAKMSGALCLLSIVAMCNMKVLAAPHPLVPALFIFGDSTVDAGNNNWLPTQARADHPPYGMSFPFHIPTGRVSDGLLIPDFIAQYLGLPIVPPYLLARDHISQGVNFASASSGVLDETHIEGAWPLSTQVDKFSEVRGRLVRKLGQVEASQLISKSIFYIGIGNNDVNNHLQRHHSLPPTAEEAILAKFEAELKRLYNMGARKFVVVGLSAVGCIPINQMEGRCSPEAQQVAFSFNMAFDSLLTRLRSTLPGAQIVRTNYYGLMEEVHNNPRPNGFMNTAQGCCPLGEPSPRCLITSPHCLQPSDYMFFDGIHPSQHFNKIAADRWWNGEYKDVLPMNIHQLATS